MPGRKSKQPAFVQSCVQQVLTNDRRRSVSSAFAICTASAQKAGQLVPGTRMVTPRGAAKISGYGAQKRAQISRGYEQSIARKNPSESFDSVRRRMKEIASVYGYSLQATPGEYYLIMRAYSNGEPMFTMSAMEGAPMPFMVTTSVYAGRGRAGPDVKEYAETYMFSDLDSAWMYMQRMMAVAAHHGLYGARVRMTHANRGPHYGKGDPLPLPGGHDRLTRRNPNRVNDRVLDGMRYLSTLPGFEYAEAVNTGERRPDTGYALLSYAFGPVGEVTSVQMAYQSHNDMIDGRNSVLRVTTYRADDEQKKRRPPSYTFTSIEDASAYMMRTIQALTSQRGQLNVRTRRYPTHGGDPLPLPGSNRRGR